MNWLFKGFLSGAIPNTNATNVVANRVLVLESESGVFWLYRRRADQTRQVRYPLMLALDHTMSQRDTC